MSNTEWKNGFGEGFAAGWTAAKKELTVTVPVVSESLSQYSDCYTFAGGGTMIDTDFPPVSDYTISLGNVSVPTDETYNLTKHTRIV